MDSRVERIRELMELDARTKAELKQLREQVKAEAASLRKPRKPMKPEA
jgi:hypothetical protein